MTEQPRNGLRISSANDGSASVCCPGLMKFSFSAMAVLTAISIASAAYFAGISRSETDIANLPILEATSAVTSDGFSMATGAVSEDADGLFVLDHNSGLLQCNVIYPRVGRFMAQFSINVADAIGASGKGGKYMMLTGRADFPRASNRPAAGTVVYVIDSATGNYACYGIPFDRVAMNANRVQKGALIWIASGSANPVVDRDNMR
ncbi:hypothetical protein LF1_01610 [Rubripirellula obstinata]|uniref:Uncharacterized protein n=2 Tax=Rubripirellula obstinata TaxID=406547 RepID=A0A5B1CDY5_9BACT|nr:hypothetical protein LF1_01610 [Rubripirellula obstinata]